MKTNSAITKERLRSAVADKSGCTTLYLRVLKSDLNNLLSQYMSHEGIEFSLKQTDEGYTLNICVAVNEFLELGLGG